MLKTRFLSFISYLKDKNWNSGILIVTLYRNENFISKSIINTLNLTKWQKVTQVLH